MQRIIYISTARNEISDSDIAQILDVSRLNNRRDGLTGLLIAGNRRFLQVLEGDALALGRTFRRITADPRHFAVVELERRSIDLRAFGQWDMGFLQPAGLGGESLAATVERLTEQLEEASLKAHLRGFAELHSRAA